jgi:hypothetical protein
MEIRNYADVKVYIKTEDILKENVVYKLTFPNGKVYIGQTTQKLNQRLTRHCNTAFKSNDRGFNDKKARAIRKYLTFSVDILYQGKDLNQKEIEFIQQYDSMNKGYNSTTGGEGVPGKIMSNDQKDAISKAQKNRVRTDKEKEFHRNILIGKTGKESRRALKVSQFSKNGEFIRDWDCIMDVEREIGIKHNAICNNLKGLSKSSGGFIWKYKE